MSEEAIFVYILLCVKIRKYPFPSVASVHYNTSDMYNSIFTVIYLSISVFCIVQADEHNHVVSILLLYKFLFINVMFLLGHALL